MLHEVYNNLRDSLWIHIAFIHQELYHFNLSLDGSKVYKVFTILWRQPHDTNHYCACLFGEHELMSWLPMSVHLVIPYTYES